jgi:hypothetical protein
MPVSKHRRNGKSRNSKKRERKPQKLSDAHCLRLLNEFPDLPSPESKLPQKPLWVYLEKSRFSRNSPLDVSHAIRKIIEIAPPIPLDSDIPRWEIPPALKSALDGASEIAYEEGRCLWSQYCGIALLFPSISDAPEPKFSFLSRPTLDCININLFSEVRALMLMNLESSLFQQGRRVVLEATARYCLGLLSYDAWLSECRNGATVLAKSATQCGRDDMRDDLVWLFIPKFLQRELDLAFDGIGGWRA